MRVHKYKGKRTDNGEWTIGHLYASKSLCRIIHAMAFEQDIDEGMWYCEGHDVNPATVGKYTGLPDKNGKEIYEFDIVQNRAGKNFYPYVVVYCRGAFRLADYIAKPFDSNVYGCDYSGLNKGQSRHFRHTPNDFVVIGNIHDTEVIT